MATLFSKVKDYRDLSRKLQLHLAHYPNDWRRFQDIFNSKIDKVIVDILQSEKIDKRVDKLRMIFQKRYRQHFLYGDYVKWSFKKPFGYSGDFKIIEDIYLNQPSTTGFDRLWDNRFLQLDASKATRERKEDFKQIIYDFVKSHRGLNIRIMNLASGPAREIKELLEVDSNNYFSNVLFDCYDLENKAIEYAKQLLNSYSNINFLQKNVVRLALKRDITQEITWKYDLIYSMGLFDYLEEKLAIRLIRNLRNLLKKNGMLIVSNYTVKDNNISACLMEWIAEWNLIYRSEEEFRELFIAAGFKPNELRLEPQKSKVMHYCFAKLS